MKRYMLMLLLLLTFSAASQENEIHDYSILFISDLHIGVGRDPEDPKQWHNTEDFRWHDAFHEFLEKMVETDSGSIDLVILGDFLELWQSLTDDCNHEDDKDLGCSEAEALARMDRVLLQHKQLFEDLSWFAEQGQNTITIVAGNHDVALAFPSVREKLLEAFNETVRGRIRIEETGIWESPDGRIVAEHGQQIGSDPNKFDGWPDKPFIVKDGTTYLIQPWGESFVQELFNEVEEKYPIIDNLSSEMEGFKYVYKSATPHENLDYLGQAVRFFFTQTSWRQAAQILGEDGMPVWKLEDLQRELVTDEARWRFLIDSFENNDPLRISLETVSLAPSIAPFTFDEIKAICDRRYTQTKDRPDLAIASCPSTGKLGATTQSIAEAINPKARNSRFKSYFGYLRKDARISDKFTRYVYGHTHKVEIAYNPYGSDPNGILVYNDGAWQRTVTPQQLCEIAKQHGWKDEEVLDVATPEHLPACYPFVTARWNSKAKKLMINNLYWVDKPTGGNWETTCTVAPVITKDCL